jgi:hypothetical protein
VHSKLDMMSTALGAIQENQGYFAEALLLPRLAPFGFRGRSLRLQTGAHLNELLANPAGASGTGHMDVAQELLDSMRARSEVGNGCAPLQ